MIREKLFSIKEYSENNPGIILGVSLFFPILTFLVGIKFFDVSVVARALFVMSFFILIGPVRWSFLKINKDKDQ